MIAELLPPPGLAALVAVIGLVVGSCAALWVASLRRGGMRVAYTRKLFHVVVFTCAAAVHLVWALPGTVVFGSVVAGLVVGAVILGGGHPFYEALARDSDRPHRTLFVLVPLVTTAVGGLVSAMIAGPFAAVGYLAAGWGDAVGEPVGSRWGRHPYRVPSLAGVPATRTLEGSAAVLAVSTVGSVLAIVWLGTEPSRWWVGAVCGLTAAAVESVSHHGLDNFTVQVGPSFVAALLLA